MVSNLITYYYKQVFPQVVALLSEQAHLKTLALFQESVKQHLSEGIIRLDRQKMGEISEHIQNQQKSQYESIMGFLLKDLQSLVDSQLRKE